ncbi:hypothetical protein BGX26_003664 [Mortierella sp. AD094]|nr:hypothetical protein BGX26_003664 [Mortierella sp. AD094]
MAIDSEEDSRSREQDTSHQHKIESQDMVLAKLDKIEQSLAGQTKLVTELPYTIPSKNSEAEPSLKEDKRQPLNDERQDSLSLIQCECKSCKPSPPIDPTKVDDGVPG